MAGKKLEVVITHEEPKDVAVVLYAMLMKATDNELRAAFDELPKDRLCRVAQKLHGVIYTRI